MRPEFTAIDLIGGSQSALRQRRVLPDNVPANASGRRCASKPNFNFNRASAM
jgi:hypothetical protein